MIVHKFGGTSLATADRIRSVAETIEQGIENSPAVVVSAVGGVTNRLISCARSAALGDRETCRTAREWLLEKHRALAENLLGVGAEYDDFQQTVEDSLAWLDRFLDSVAVLGELSARSHDAVAGLGEALSSTLVAAVLRQRGLRAQAIHAKALIVTDEQYGSANPIMTDTAEKSQALLLPLIEDGVVPVITGYVGATSEGVLTTLGRSGSDFSAAIIAACLESDELWIWTDVNGILTADPNVVPGARVLRELSFGEAGQLARFGAEVLHPHTIAPIIEKGIPLRILNSLNPEDEGTRIVETTRDDRTIQPAIVSATGLQLLQLRDPQAQWTVEDATEVLKRLSAAGVGVRMFGQSFSEQGMTVVVGQHDGPHSTRILSLDNPPATAYHLDTVERVATISVIGWDGHASARIASRAFAALGKCKVRIVAVAQAATEDSVTFCVPAADADHTVRLLHQELGLEVPEGVTA